MFTYIYIYIYDIYIYIYIHIRVKPSDKHSRSVLSQLCTMEGYVTQHIVARWTGKFGFVYCIVKKLWTSSVYWSFYAKREHEIDSTGAVISCYFWVCMVTWLI